jgi:hypothetical protein
MTAYDALVTLVAGVALAFAFGLLGNKIFRLPDDHADEPGDLAEVAHLCEARTRREARNGIGGRRGAA